MPGAPVAHVIVGELSAPELTPDDAHHLGAVLRLRVGEPVGLTDGRGGYGRGRWAGAGRVELDAQPSYRPRPEPGLTVGFVPVKGDRPEWVVQKLTEVGVDRIVVMRSARSVIRWEGPRAAAQVERLAKVARAAVMQSRRCWVPQVVGVTALTELLGPATAMADPGGRPLDLARTTVVIGPEGGWSDDERAQARAAGCARVSLGDGVLRAETAAVAAGVLLAALRDGRVGPSR